MLTPLPEIEELMVASIPFLSAEQIRILVGKVEFPSSAHRASMRLRGSAAREFMQSAVWTVTPLPLVIKPTILSPGSGLQQPAKLMRTLSIPSILTSPFGRLVIRLITFSSPPSSVFFSSVLSFSGARRPITCCVVIFP